ncbi:hypothetical protein P5W99_10895 [Paraburkholderia sp. A3BS-1L]|uniref:hypothetical protein n=1 Tax=Paraburkholderia sp. A3BS-1L TaxID=3028375 RepID=UPI003DA9EAB0
MINLTDKLQYVGPGPSSRKIGAVVDEVCAATTAHEEGTSRSHHTEVYAFGDMFLRVHRRGAKKLDKFFLEEGLRLTCAHSRARALGPLTDYSLNRVAATGIPYVTAGMRLVLLHLWDDGQILLPTCFLPRNKVHYVNSVTLENFDVQLEGYRKAEYIAHFLRATDWKRPEDIDIHEAADFLRAHSLAETGRYSYSFTGSGLPVTAFLAEMQMRHPSRVRYSDPDLKELSLWSSKYKEHCTFAEYLANPPLQQEKRAALRPKLEKSTRRAPPKPRREARADFLDATQRETEAKLHSLSDAEERNEAILDYFRCATRHTWNENDCVDGVPQYQYREHAKPSSEVTAPWVRAWNAFISHRKLVGNIQKSGTDRSARSIMFLYLFCYLPWWKEQFPNGMVDIPDRPDKFTTFPFFVNIVRQQLDGTTAAHADIDKYPTPLRDFIKVMRPSDTSSNVVIRTLRYFFEYTSDYLSVDPLVCDGAFKNPILGDLNFPESRQTRTNKITIPVDIEGHLTMYMYSLEAFGEFLLESTVDNRLNDYASKRSTESTTTPWDACSAGYVPFYWYRGRFHPVTEIPSVINWATRKVKRPNGETTELRVPHLTTLRLCAAGNECGQRFQHIQWLDIGTWDSDNAREPADAQFAYGPTSHYTYTLYLNTDKRRTTGHDTIIVYRARACMLREEIFQSKLCQDPPNTPVAYEGRENSHFEPIVPLFRSAEGAKPVSDETYQRIWVETMYGFQQHYHSMYEEVFIQFVYIKPPPGESKDIRYADGSKYCEINWRATSTPHSSRATFVTNRYGILEVSETGYVIGHSTNKSTNYYNNPQINALKVRFASAHQALYRDFLPLEDGAIIRAHKSDSDLVKSFRDDRERAISSFGFMRPFTLWGFQTLDALAEDAFNLLANNPMGQIVFRETHICPVGEQCPEELVVKAGETKRCGMCPLAMKCVDHIQAIQAKVNFLDERIVFFTSKKESMEQNDEPLSSINQVWDAINLDANELLGWKHSLDALDAIRQKMQDTGKDEVVYFADEPELVRKKLKKYSVNAGLGLQLATRIIEASAFPAFNTEALDIQAKILKRRLLSGKGARLPEFSDEVVNASPAVAVTAMLKVIMREMPETFEQVMASIGQSPPSNPELTWETQ